MPFGTPNGSDGGSPMSRHQSRDFAKFLNAGFEQLETDLIQFQKDEGRRTPEIQQPEEVVARPLSWRERCEALWASLPNEEKLDQSRLQIPSVLYQFLIAFAHFRLLAKKLGYEGVSPGLLDDESDRSEQPCMFWRQVTDNTLHILERAGTSKEEVREHLQEIPLEQFWEVEYRFLERVAAEEELKYHKKMADDVQRRAQSPQQELSAELEKAPQVLNEGKRPERVQKAANNRGPTKQKPPNKTEKVAAPIAFNFVMSSMDTGPAVGDSFVSISSKAKTSRIMNGLNTEDILKESSRLRKRRKNNAEQTTAGDRVVGGRVGTKNRGRASQVRNPTAPSRPHHS